MAKADGGCETCARELFAKFAEEYPEHRELARSLFKEIFNVDMDDNGSGTQRGSMYDFDE